MQRSYYLNIESKSKDFQYWIMNNGGDDAESMLQNRIKGTT